MEQRKYILEHLKSCGIYNDFKEEMDAMEKEKAITPNTPSETAKTLFYLRMSSKEPLFHSLLKNDDVLFDISFIVDTKRQRTIQKAEIKRALTDVYYVYSERRGDATFYGLKLKEASEDDYTKLAKIFEKPEDVIFFEHPVAFCTNDGVDSAFKELMFHLMSLDLPLSIIHYDLAYRHTNPLPIYQGYIYLESSAKWPKNDEAIQCAKTAFYCQLHKQSNFSVFIDKNSVTFRYKELYFSISILLDSDKTPKYFVEEAVQREIEKKLISKILSIKKVLMDIGVYPLLIDNLLIDTLALSVPKTVINDALFVKLFFSRLTKASNQIFDITKKKLSKNHSKGMENFLVVLAGKLTYNIPLPPKSVLDYISKATSLLRFWEGSIMDSKGNLLTLNLEVETRNCDFMLHIEPTKSSKEIVGALCTDFDLGTPIYSSFMTQDVMRDIQTVYYSPTHQTLGIKVKPGASADLVANILISITSFRYITMVNK